MGLKVTYNRDGSVHIYQPPGEKNALGRIRFNFPNKFLVYQHDTPDKHMFGHERRAYSHGCMRVQDPAKYGEVLLSLTQAHEGYTADRLKKMFGAGEVQINLSVHVPVHLTYQTAFVDEDGKLQIREDIYGRDARMLAALKTEDRRLADVPIERRETSYQRPRMPTGYGGPGFGFFDHLFGAGRRDLRLESDGASPVNHKQAGSGLAGQFFATLPRYPGRWWGTGSAKSSVSPSR